MPDAHVSCFQLFSIHKQAVSFRLCMHRFSIHVHAVAFQASLYMTRNRRPIVKKTNKLVKVNMNGRRRFRNFFRNYLSNFSFFPLSLSRFSMGEGKGERGQYNASHQTTWLFGAPTEAPCQPSTCSMYCIQCSHIHAIFTFALHIFPQIHRRRAVVTIFRSSASNKKKQQHH